jgi:hypothetical protein
MLWLSLPQIQIADRVGFRRLVELRRVAVSPQDSPHLSAALALPPFSYIQITYQSTYQARPS